ncbi:SnodProt1 [Trichodelitschia bisporula]|uniref:SnodProt1 n=1 Tax=Trichodelitschia bisporula TaxID=703511 RepID=A0A6G1HJF5_9PEZI|nr:SnodProt1 [Trichodelitschia bisporula]
MRFFSLPALLFALPAVCVRVSYDTIYDNPAKPLTEVACSDGDNGFLQYGYKTVSDLPNFPYIGGAQEVGGWNSPACGVCFNMTYNGTALYVTAIDHSATGFNIAHYAMDSLTGFRASALGVVDAEANRHCGT